MDLPPLTESARRFLRDDIGSLERLDILLLMQQHAARWWTAAALAGELRIPSPQVEEGLEALGRRNLISVRVAEDILSRYDPGTPALRQLVDLIVEAHYADRGAIALMVSTRRRSAELFADAFRWRKGSNDG